MKLQDKILYCRKKAGFSQEALAEQIGVSRQAISKWETGDAAPELSKLPLLASVFNVTADWLLSEEEPLIEAEPEHQEQPVGTSWVDSIPGLLGNLLRRFGWLFGVYVAIAGAGFTFIGGLARILVRNMFSNAMTGFGAFPFSDGGTIWYDEAGNVLSAPFGGSISSFGINNPVYTMGTVIMVLGIILLITGIVLAIYLKRRFTGSNTNFS